MTAEKCDVEGNMKANNIVHFMMKGPESTTAVLTRRTQQWQRAIIFGLRLISSAELSWCRVFRKGLHRPMHSHVRHGTVAKGTSCMQ